MGVRPMSQLVRKIVILVAGFFGGWFPPEAVVMLMEPPPGKGLAPHRPDPVSVARHPAVLPRHRRRRRYRAPRHDDR